MTMMISPAQSRMARAALGLGTEEMRRKAGLGVNTITRFEKGRGLQVETMRKLVMAYNAEGIEFPDGETVRIVSPQAARQAA